MSAALNQLIREVAETMAPDVTPRDIALVVIDKAGEELMREFLPDLVTAATYTVLAQSRNAALNLSKGRADGGPCVSKKVARRRSYFEQLMVERVPIGEGQWKLMRDATPDELEYCVDIRVQQRDALDTQIDTYRRLIDAARRFRCDVIGDLSPDLVDL